MRATTRRACVCRCGKFKPAYAAHAGKPFLWTRQVWEMMNRSEFREGWHGSLDLDAATLSAAPLWLCRLPFLCNSKVLHASVRPKVMRHDALIFNSYTKTCYFDLPSTCMKSAQLRAWYGPNVEASRLTQFFCLGHFATVFFPGLRTGLSILFCLPRRPLLSTLGQTTLFAQ